MTDKVSSILDRLDKILYYLPHLLLALSLLVTGILFIIARLDLLSKGWIILLPVIIISLILIFNKKLGCDTKNMGFNITPSRLLKIYLITLLLLLIWLGLGNQGLVYLILLFSMYCIILIQLFSKKTNPKWLLFELIATSALLALPQMLVRGIYYGDTDVTGHVYFVIMIQNYGWVPQDIFGQYQFFCLYHIFGAVASSILGINANSTLCILTAAVVLSSIPITYLLSKYFTKSEIISLFSAFFYALMPMIILAILIPAPRVMATMAFFIVVYLLFSSKNKQSIQYIVITLLIVTYMTGVHHAQLPLFIIVMMLLCIGSIIYFRKITIGNPIVLLIFFIVPVIYLSYTYLSTSVEIFETRFISQIETEAIATTIISADTGIISIQVLISALSSCVLIILIFAGLYMLLTRTPHSKKISILSPLILITFIFFVPYVVDIFPTLTMAFQLYRFRLAICLFFAIIMGIGVVVLINLSQSRSKDKLLKSLIFILCLTFVFSSPIMSYSTNNDIFYQIDFLNPTERLLGEEEASMLSSLQEFIPLGSTLYADHRDIRCFSSDPSVEKYGLSYYAYGMDLLNVFISPDEDMEKYNYILFPIERYERNGLMLFAYYTDYVSGKFEDPSENPDSLVIFYENTYHHNLMYDNDGNKIYYRS